MSPHSQEPLSKTGSQPQGPNTKNMPNSQGPLNKAAAQTQDITHKLSSQIQDLPNKMSPAQESTRDSDNSKNTNYAVSLPNYPVTEMRKPYKPTSNSRLVDAGTARVNYAPSVDSPNGTTENNYAKEHAHETVIVQHCAYWDTDSDGVIWPQDTYRGCRDFGWNVFLSAYATFLINGALSYPTVPTILPDPFFRIYTARIHKDKHGSDSMTYDAEGRFRPQLFEDFFNKYDRDGKGGLDKWDLWYALQGQRMVFDFFGWLAAFFEWLATYLLIWPEDGVLRKEEVRGVYDGSIFFKKRDETMRKRAAKKNEKLAQKKLF